MSYQCKIIADSVGPMKTRLTTFEVTFPRFILAEVNTHRQFSRNSASSRAIPIKRMIERCEIDPFVPFYWGANQAGMQASQEVSKETKSQAVNAWMGIRDDAVSCATYLSDLGVHKQLANRPMEPFQWHTAIITATHWKNFFAQRCNPAAQPEFQRIARMMRDLYVEHTPTALKAGEWHLPYIQREELTADGGSFCVDSATFVNLSAPEVRMISAGRCARVSYLNHDGVRSNDDDISLCEKMRTHGHMSPFEHQAQALDEDEAVQETVKAMWKWFHHGVPVGNFHPSWRQYRKCLEGEHEFGTVENGRSRWF